MKNTDNSSQNLFETYNSLLYSCGVDIDECFELKKNKLIYFEDISRHGSACMVPCKEIEISELEYKVISTLLSVKKEVKELSNKQEADSIIREIEFLQNKLKFYENTGK